MKIQFSRIVNIEALELELKDTQDKFDKAKLDSVDGFIDHNICYCIAQINYLKDQIELAKQQSCK